MAVHRSLRKKTQTLKVMSEVACKDVVVKHFNLVHACLHSHAHVAPSHTHYRTHSTGRTIGVLPRKVKKE